MILPLAGTGSQGFPWIDRVSTTGAERPAQPTRQCALLDRGTPLRRSRTISTSPGRAVAPLSQTPLLDAYASSSRHTPGTVVWPRANPRPKGLACSGYASAASAQTAFLNSGGPGTDRLGLDPDGDGYACGWNPAPYQNSR